MSDDRLIRANEREIFEAIVSQVVDPELVRLRRMFLVMGVSLFVLGTLAVAVVGGLGVAGVGAFCSTFVPGLIVARSVYVRRFSLSGSRWRRPPV
jgi:hypothetical protein